MLAAMARRGEMVGTCSCYVGSTRVVWHLILAFLYSDCNAEHSSRTLTCRLLHVLFIKLRFVVIYVVKYNV